MTLTREELKNISVEELEKIKFKMIFDKDRMERLLNQAYEKNINVALLRKLMQPEYQMQLYNALLNREYKIFPPHKAKIPKDNGDFRTVYVNEDIDRIYLSLYNDMMFELHSCFISTFCKSYQKGISCPNTVKAVSKKLRFYEGYKADMTHYFDSTPLEQINKLFDRLRMVTRVDLPVREYYNSNLVFDENDNLIEEYAGMKQGCAFSTFLANALLYEIDETLGNMEDLLYVRYSDDILFVGKDYEKAKMILENELSKLGLELNPNKTDNISNKEWFDFLGFKIKGSQITFSTKSINELSKFILKNTIKYKRKNKQGKIIHVNSKQKAINKINAHLYKNFTINNKRAFGWGEYFLTTVNVRSDIEILDKWIKDCIRACETKKIKVGGIGSINNNSNYTVDRPQKSRDVSGNLDKTDKEIKGYRSMVDMWKTINNDKNMYRLKARMM